MKILTGNDLRSGDVVWWTGYDWSRHVSEAAEVGDNAPDIMAREVAKPATSYFAPTRRYAIGLGCETRHASEVVYADDLDLSRDAGFEPIGISCRICERSGCHQRSVPPMKHAIMVDHDRREELPYRLSAPVDG